MVNDKEVAKAHALSLLEQKDIQESLADVFAFYAYDLYDILTIATVENAGVRPERLTNEIFSSFHHIARGLCVDDREIDVNKELNSARSSHLKRAALDSYKISINAALSEDNKAKELLDYLVLVEDFTRFVPDGLDKVNKIKAVSRAVKQSYASARQHEAHGNFDGALTSYNEALEGCYDLRDKLTIFTHDKSYILACAREAKKEREATKNRWLTIGVAILAAALSAYFTHQFPQWLGHDSTTSAEVATPAKQTLSATPMKKQKLQ